MEPETPGLLARHVAADILENVLLRRRPLDEQLQEAFADSRQDTLSDRDRALVRVLTATVLRRLGTLRHLLNLFLARGLPRQAPRVESALLIGAAQILWLHVPDYAAVDLAVQLVQADAKAAAYVGLVNAVLRRMTREGAARLAAIEPAALDTPDWLMGRWTRTYGPETAHAIALAHSREPALDFTITADAEGWAYRLAGRVLPTASVRAVVHGATPQLSGYCEGAWWVQDAAAALPARLLGDIKGARVADLCAAPGGKTAQLAAAGASVVAVDRAPRRLARLRENLARLHLHADVVEADVLQWQASPFDAVLLDAPCSSTGTIRRHPDIPWSKRESDIVALADLQRRLLARAAELVKPGGRLVFATCSLEPEEGVQNVRDFLVSQPSFRRVAIRPGESQIAAEWLTQDGDLRTLPCHLPDADPAMAGLDGFYAARLERI